MTLPVTTRVVVLRSSVSSPRSIATSSSRPMPSVGSEKSRAVRVNSWSRSSRPAGSPEAARRKWSTVVVASVVGRNASTSIEEDWSKSVGASSRASGSDEAGMPQEASAGAATQERATATQARVLARIGGLLVESERDRGGDDAVARLERQGEHEQGAAAGLADDLERARVQFGVLEADGQAETGAAGPAGAGGVGPPEPVEDALGVAGFEP